MKKIFPAFVIAAILFSCNRGSDKGNFTVNGEIKSVTDQKIYLEEIYFSDKQPEVLDTGDIKNGKFTVSAIATEEGLYRLRTADSLQAYFFISEPGKITLTADANSQEISSRYFSGAANSSLKKLLLYSDSLGLLISNKNRLLNEFMKAGISETDSIFTAIAAEYNQLTGLYSNYCFAYADTAKSPVVSLFAATMAPVEPSKFEAPLINLTKRFPYHKGIAGALAYIKTQATPQSVVPPKAAVTVGDMAPEFTMNDVNDNPFSLSQLRGKYVLIDFWASWCAPCREENPNVVAAYNQFKEKNFTVLGVSLDKNKDAWINAIKKDNLTWQQISDLKHFNSIAVELFGFSGIPYNVLIDPQGKIIATALTGNALQNKLAEVLIPN